MVKQSNQIVDEKLNGILSIADIARPVTTDIIRDNVEFLVQNIDLRFPHFLAERKSMNQDNRQTGARSLHCIFNSYAVGYKSHSYCFLENSLIVFPMMLSRSSGRYSSHNGNSSRSSMRICSSRSFP